MVILALKISMVDEILNQTILQGMVTQDDQPAASDEH
jgi:hypothetical protein